MSGPLPLPIEHGASSYGEETNIQDNIKNAAQYNPQTKLGITAGDGPAQPAESAIPSTADILKKGLGAKSGFEPTAKGQPAPITVQAAPRPVQVGPDAVASHGLEQHHQVLNRLTNISPALKEYLDRGLNGG